MSVLNNKITKESLLAAGFYEDGWGSPYDRATKNTQMFEKVIENEVNMELWVVDYFPIDFEGIVVPGGERVVEMAGRLMVREDRFAPLSEVYIIDIHPDVADMNDIEVFVSQVMQGKVKPTKLHKSL